MKTKFTIIVPTRERSKPLYFCLSNLLKQDYENFEVLVSDNNSQDETKTVVSSFTDARIRYVNTGNRVSMSHNWEFALSHVDEGWVLFVGDDDGLLQGALQTLNEVILVSGCEALTTASCIYWWPLHFSSIPDGELTIPFPVNDLFEVKESALMLDLVMRGQAAYRDLPWLYNGGAASVTLLNRLRAADGKYFRSLNPDLYSAISLALGTVSYASINAPIAINGASKFSNGTSGALGQKEDPTSAASKFLSEGNLPFHPYLICSKSFQIQVYESYLQASHLYPRQFYGLANQLKIALILAPTSDFQQVLKECKLMAMKHNIPIPGAMTIAYLRAISRIYGFLGVIGRRRVIAIPASKLEAWDVDRASNAAKYLYEMFDYFFQRSLLTRAALRSLFFLTSLSRYSRRMIARFWLSN